MNKAELIDVVASRIDASKKDAAEAVQAVVDAITEAVARGQKVSISGFGVFERSSRPARTYRKPSTGEAIQKLATAVPRFRPGGDFKAFVSGEKNIAEMAVRAVRDAGDDMRDAAEGAVRRVTGQREPAPAKATAKATPAKAAPATAAGATAAPAPAKKAAAKKSTAAKSTAAKKAPARKTTAKKASTATTAKATATKAPAKKAPARKSAAKKAAATPAAPADVTPSSPAVEPASE